MTGLRFVQVDAFATRAFAGNPAAVMMLDAWPADALLQAIAAENALPETAFVAPAPPGGEADHRLRWFSPVREVAMCGHATLAAGHVLLGDDPARARIRFATAQAGLLEVRRTRDGYALDLPALAPQACALPAVAAALGVEAVAGLWHPAGYAAIVVADAAAVRGCAPDPRALAALGNWLVIVTAPGDRTDIVSRAFAPASGVDEDPVTGSAHAVVAPYWAARLGRPRLTAEQASPRGGELTATFAGDRVTLEGNCVTVIEGTFRLPA